MNNAETKIQGKRSKKYQILDTIGSLLDRLSKTMGLHKTGSCALAVTRIELALPHLPVEFNGYRIVQISDLHYGTWLEKPRLEEAVERVNAFEPDTVVITGDFVSYHPERYSEVLIGVLSRLRARDQVAAILGNHDHWSGAEEVRRILQFSHIKDMSNRVTGLKKGAARLFLAGVDDILNGLDRLDLVLDQIPQGEPAILLAHEPDFADKSRLTKKFGLQLSGHSHGRQIDLPIVSRLFLPSLSRKYPAGLYDLDGMYLYTNRGLGTTWLSLRYNCPPEILVLDLCSEPG